MPNFSFLNFRYGRNSAKSQSKNKPQTSSSKTNPSSTQRQISSTKPSLSPSSSSSSSSSSSTTTRNPNNHSSPSVQELRWAFEKFDANKDGKISREEYTSALRALDRDISDAEVARTFQALDSDGDGSIDFAEFSELFGGAVGPAGGGDDVASAFRLFDVDGDGRISAEELAQVMRRLGEGCSVKACRDMVRGVDSDGDGFISMEEFTRMMSSSTSSKKFTNNNY